MNGENLRPIRVWDAPVRLFHWTLVLLLTGSVTTGLVGGNWMLWHMRFGYALLALVVFRVLWGLMGSSTARFADFVYGVPAAARFARDLFTNRPAHYHGHNPLGGWMVVALLVAVLVQATTGLFANDDIATEGPLYGLIGKDLSDRLTSIHKLNIKVIYVLAGIHVAAVLFHWFGRGENLVQAMFSGTKMIPPDASGARPRFSSPWLALVLFAAASIAVWLLVTFPTIFR